MKMSESEERYKPFKPTYEEFVCGEECGRVKTPCRIKIPRGGEAPKYCPISGEKVTWWNVEKCCPRCGKPMEREELLTSRYVCDAEYYHFFCPHCGYNERIIYDALEPFWRKEE